MSGAVAIFNSDSAFHAKFYRKFVKPVVQFFRRSIYGTYFIHFLSQLSESLSRNFITKYRPRLEE
jgi:hypothetical protein